MTFDTCTTCGKRTVTSCASFSEVRRVSFVWDLCTCPGNNSPADIKIAVSEAMNRKKGGK